MNKSLLSFLLGILFLGAHAQVAPFSKVFYDSTKYGVGATSVIADYDKGSFVVVGNSYTKGGLVTKFDSSGKLLWDKTFNYTIGAQSAFNSIIPSYDSNYVLVGDFHDSTVNRIAALITKLNKSGTPIWSQLITKPSNDVQALSVSETNDSGYVVTGYSYSSVSPYNNVFVARISNAGLLLWSKFFSVNGYGFSVKQCADSGFVVAGQASNHGLLVRLNKSGGVVWTKNFSLSGSSSTPVSFFDVDVTSSGFYIHGNVSSDLLLIKIGFNGNIIWQKSHYPGAYYGNQNDPKPRWLKESDNQYYIAVGSCTGSSFFSADSSGNLNWVKNPMLAAAGVVLAKDSGFIIVGNGPFCAVRWSNLTSPQIAIIKTDTAGDGATCSGSNGFGLATNTIIVTSPSYSVTAGATIRFVSLHRDSILMTHYDGCIGVSGDVKENSFLPGIDLFPNPASQKLTVQCSDENKKDINILNVTGKIVRSLSFKTTETTIDVSDLNDGLYFVRISSSEGSKTVKLVVQH